VIRLVLIWAYLITASIALAQLPDAPVYKPALITLGGAMILDGESTQYMLGQGCHEVWNPELYGRYPSRFRFYTLSAGMFAATVLVTKPMMRSRSRLWHAVSWGLIGWQLQDRLHGAVHNFGLNTMSCR
jgi:hypothetical protein